MITPETIKNERVDDIPLLLRHMQQMGLGELLDQHLDFSDDRLAEVLRLLSDDDKWPTA